MQNLYRRFRRYEPPRHEDLRRDFVSTTCTRISIRSAKAKIAGGKGWNKEGKVRDFPLVSISMVVPAYLPW